MFCHQNIFWGFVALLVMKYDFHRNFLSGLLLRIHIKPRKVYIKDALPRLRSSVKTSKLRSLLYPIIVSMSSTTKMKAEYWLCFSGMLPKVGDENSKTHGICKRTNQKLVKMQKINLLNQRFTASCQEEVWYGRR